MRHHPASLWYALTAVAVALPTIAAAQTAQTKTLSFYRGTVGGDSVAINGLLRIKYAGAKIASASLDVCLAPRIIGSTDERVVLPLQAAANGQLTYDKAAGPVDSRSVKLRVQGGADDTRLNGTVRRGDATIVVKEENLSLADEARPEQGAEPGEDNANDRSVTTNTIMFDIKPKAIGRALGVLKAQPVTFLGQSLIPTCQEQRDDKVSGSINVPPKRAGEMMKLVETIPGVSNVHKGGGAFARSEAILVPQAESTDLKAVLDRAAKVIAKETGGTLVSIEEDEESGSSKIVIDLPSQTMDGLALKKQVTVEVLVEPAADVKGASVLFWQLSNYKFSLAGTDEKFKIDDISVGGEGGSGDDSTPWKAAMAAEFKGKTWDDEKKVWNARRP